MRTLNISFITWIELSLIIALISISVVWQFTTILQVDLAWHLYVAEQIIEGKRLYRDFFEVKI